MFAHRIFAVSIVLSGALSGAATLLMPTAVQAADISGTIELEASRRLGKVSVENTVVFFRPNEPLIEPAIQRRIITSEMKMERKQFVPAVLNVDIGTKIHFPNVDRVIHNAFSSSKSTRFDLGLYSGGEAREHVFEQAGLVRVFCNVHQDMAGYVMVLDTPYHTKPKADGTFVIPNVQPGEGKLFVWHPRGKTYSESFVLAEEDRLVDVSLKLTKRLVPSHKNKFGKAYSKKKRY